MPWADLTNVKLEIGYLYFTKLLTYLSSDIQIMTIITSSITIPIYGWFIYKKSKNTVVSSSLFVLLNLYFMMLNIVRQELAVAIILIAYYCLTKNKKIICTLLILLATTIHTSAIICLFFIPLYGVKFKKNYLIISFFLIIIILVSYKGLINGYNDISIKLGIASNNKEYTSYIEDEKYGKGSTNLNTITTIILGGSFFILGYYYIVCIGNSENNEEEKEQHFYVFLTLFYTLSYIASTKIVVASRLSYYFIPFLLLVVPECMSISKIKNNKIMIMTVMFVALIGRYMYVLYNLADILYGVTPYTVFWK